MPKSCLKPIMSRSKIWKYYDKLDRNSAQCQLCEKVIKTCGNTSNLMKHMKTHPKVDLFDDKTVVVRGIYKRREQDDLKRTVMPFKEESTDFHSELLFKPAKDSGGFIELQPHGPGKNNSEDHIAVQSVGYAWVSPDAAISGTETVSADDIIEFEPKNEQEDLAKSSFQQIQDLPLQGDDLEMPVLSRRSFYQEMAFFVCRDRHPLQIIQGEGFQHLLKVLCPTYKPPSVAELERFICRETQLQRSKLRQQLATVSTLSLNCSMHTRAEGQSWLELVAHFHDGRHLISRTLSVQTLPESLTSGHLVDCMERVCQRFDINKSKITCVTTRSNRLLENAVTTFLSAKHHVPCFADQLNLLLEAVLQRPEIHGLCEKIRTYVEADRQSEEPSSQIKLQLDTMQRPLSTYDMLDQYLKHSSVHVEEPPPLSPEQMDLGQQLLDVLRPMTSSMRELSRTPYPAASKALPMAHTLINELKQEKSSEHKVAQEVRLFMGKQLEEHFEGMERNLNLAMSSLLDPRFRNIPFQRGALVAKYITQLYDMMQAHVDSGQAVVSVDHGNFDIWAAFKTFSHEKQQLINGNNVADADDEISTYFCAGLSTLQADPFQLWQELAPAHPFLYSVAQKYLHIPATALSPSRLFTADGAVVTEQYARLLENNMENVLFMADVPTDEWQI
ncbi:E3 SUMO-protein ligase ZBED1 [Drosophila gunungcola]|uniref:E3 SUMO-protein ligase ZBED1 n=1 Tax=Drosophila gunungcola TaxID=103775 RepID=UPI0022E60779|nr:E3 SUMO-protein ligase ZBED1 [Drosophila gunungcola]